MTPDVEFLIACGAFDDLLDPAELEQLEQALEQDPEALAWSEQLGASYAELSAEPEPEARPELWARITASVAAGDGVPADAEPEAQADAAEAGEPGALISISLACSFCHDTLLRAQAAYCAGCLAPHHSECFAEHGRCAAPGCGETHWVRAHAPKPVARPGLSWRKRIQYVLGFTVLAGAALNLFLISGTKTASPTAQRAELPWSVTDDGSGIAVPADEAEAEAPYDFMQITPVNEPLQANVARVAGTTVTLDAGRNKGLRVGHTFVLQVASSPGSRTWVVEVTSVSGESAIAEQRSVFRPYPPLVGDFARQCDSEGFPLTQRPQADVAPVASGAWVYYLGGRPTPEFLALTDFLLEDTGVWLQTFLDGVDPEWEGPTSPGLEPLKTGRTDCPDDLIILGATTRALPPRGLRDFVESGGGLILLAEGQGQVREFGAECALLSPVEDLAAGALEPEGSIASVESAQLALGAEDFAALCEVGRDEVSGIEAVRRTRLRGPAEALLRDPAGNPVIASWAVGKGRVIYVGAQLWQLLQVRYTEGSLYQRVWTELLERALAPAEPKVRVELNPLTGWLEVANGELPEGAPLALDVFRMGEGALVRAASREGEVLRGPGIKSRIASQAESVQGLPAGRYAWQASVELDQGSVLVGLGWFDHTLRTGSGNDAPDFLYLTERELRSRLLSELVAAGPDYSTQERARIQEAALALLACSPRFSPGVAPQVQALVDGTAAPSVELVERLGGESALGELKVPLPTRGSGKLDRDTQRLAEWKLFGEAEAAYLLGDQERFESLAAFEIAKLTLGTSWVPASVPGVAGVPWRPEAEFGPPWNYLLGQLTRPVQVDRRLVPNRFPSDTPCVIDPGACLAKGRRWHASLQLARRLTDDLDAQLEGYRTVLGEAPPRDAQVTVWVEYGEALLKALGEEPGRLFEVVEALREAERYLDGRSSARELANSARWLLENLSDDQLLALKHLRVLRAGLKLHHESFRAYPNQLRHLFSVDSVGEPDYLGRPVKDWGGPYAEWTEGWWRGAQGQPIARDPWDRPYQYEPWYGVAEGYPRGYVLTSYGADGLPGGNGDDSDLTWSSD